MQLNMLEAMNIYVNVVAQGSFIRAAEVLELHRPAVTRAVQNLEHDLGVKLLHRTTRQVSMTDVRVFIDWLCEVFGPDAHL